MEYTIKKKDFLLGGGILAVALVLFLVMKVTGSEAGNRIQVTVDGEVYGTYSLTEDQVIEVKEGDFYNRIRIEDGKAYMEEANCPDGYCERQGKISGGAQTIVCLPHKLVVEVLEADDTTKDGGEEAAPDVIAKKKERLEDVKSDEKNRQYGNARSGCDDFQLCGKPHPDQLRGAGYEAWDRQSGYRDRTLLPGGSGDDGGRCHARAFDRISVRKRHVDYVQPCRRTAQCACHGRHEEAKRIFHHRDQHGGRNRTQYWTACSCHVGRGEPEVSLLSSGTVSRRCGDRISNRTGEWEAAPGCEKGSCEVIKNSIKKCRNVHSHIPYFKIIS